MTNTMINAKSLDARAEEIVASISDWERAEKSTYPLNITGTHKYEVKAVTSTFIGDGESTVRTYYVTSIAQLVYMLNQDYNFIRRVSSDHYETVKSNYITAHYVTRVY